MDNGFSTVMVIRSYLHLRPVGESHRSKADASDAKSGVRASHRRHWLLHIDPLPIV